MPIPHDLHRYIPKAGFFYVHVWLFTNVQTCVYIALFGTHETSDGMPLTRARKGFLKQEKRPDGPSLIGGSLRLLLRRAGAGTLPIHGFPLLPAHSRLYPVTCALQSLRRIVANAQYVDAPLADA